MNLPRTNCGRCAKRELVVAASLIENLLLLVGDCLLCRKFGQLLQCAFLEAAFDEELLHLTGHFCNPCLTDAKAIDDVGVFGVFLQCVGTCIESAAAKCAEGNQFFALEVGVFQQCSHRRCVSAAPDWVAEEDDVVVLDVFAKGLDCGGLAFLLLLLPALSHCAKVAGVRLFALDFGDVAAKLFLKFLGNSLGGVALRIVEDKDFLSVAARRKEQRG